jgi:putative DNA primase/helicase
MCSGSIMTLASGTLWDGSIWRPNATCVAFQFAREVARRMAEGEEKDRVRYVVCKVSFAAGVERFAKSDPHFAVTSDYWDSNAYLLGTPAGTVNLKTGEMVKPQPHHAISKSTSVSPSETQACPICLRFLDETFSKDRLIIRFVKQFLGYSLTGDTKEQIFPFGHGGGGNGKGALLQTVRAIFGDYAKQAAMETFVASKNERHPADVASLVGARLIVVSETERNQKWAEKKIQQLTGGDPIQTRFMRQDYFEFVPTFKLFVIGNHKPQLEAGHYRCYAPAAEANPFPEQTRKGRYRLGEQARTRASRNPALAHRRMPGLANKWIGAVPSYRCSECRIFPR